MADHASLNLTMNHVRIKNYSFFIVLLTDCLIVCRYYVVVIIVGICLIVILLKFTSHGGTPLLSAERRAVLRNIARNHLANQHIRTRQLSDDEFQDTTEGGDLGDGSGSSLQQHLQSLFPEATNRDLQEAIRVCSSEQDVINHLLSQGNTLKT